MAELSATERLEQLQKRHRALEAERVQLQAKREMAQARLQEIREQARAQYGVDYVESLRRLKAEWEAENEARLTAFAEALSQAEQGLARIRANAAGESHA